MTTSDSNYSSGYVAGMLDVTAGYESTISQNQGDDSLQRITEREGWPEILTELGGGPRLPSQLAERVGKDRSSITRILRRMRACGLVEVTSDMNDGRARPHRLTAEGQRALANVKPVFSREVELGITVAVRMFERLLDHGPSDGSSLRAIADAVLGDLAAADTVVECWAREAGEAALVETERDPVTGDARYELAATDEASPVASSGYMWRSVPAVLDQRKRYRDSAIPVYVRTDRDGWGAWAHALGQADASGRSRAIVDGDLRSQAVSPPEQKFDLIYDDVDAIRSDQHEPTMQAFMEQADAKFVVTRETTDIPDGFIPLRPRRADTEPAAQ
ncbi:MAG: MarR family winged helix-turn-helix transcriptional regulator [Myxococcota bacterium]